MTTDRARVSHDPERKYTAVVAQMGRVTLEADTNEAAAISTETQRQEALEIIGPWGTPDTGFQIKKAATGLQYDFISTAGTMYVGGERIYAYDDITYSAQSDWIDRDNDPTYIHPDAAAGKTNELIYLYVEETEVTAVEDTALIESALGGPDSGARTRLVARVKRFGTDASTCETALADATSAWRAAGMALDSASMRLMSLGTLEVSFTDGAGAASECEPGSVGGYVGADNQLIRIRVVINNETGAAGLLWGYDNASVAYRIDTVSGSQTVTLHQAPVDQNHWPRAAQTVEVLGSAAQLYTGAEVLGEEKSQDDYVASPTGALTTVASVAKPFDPDQLQLMLSDAVTFTSNPSAMPPAFLRMWQSKIDGVSLTKPVQLLDSGGSGIGVNVTLNTVGAGDVLRDGDFWHVGLRPNKSDAVYPARIKDVPQRADGPRRWACPLAVITWNADGPFVIEECRNPFDNLVDLSKRFPPAAGSWPVVTKISWPNDGVVLLPDFNKGLTVAMSRSMNQKTVTEQTFQVWLDLGPSGEPAAPSSYFRLPYGLRGRIQPSTKAFRFVPQPSLSGAELQQWINDLAIREKMLPNITQSPGIRCRVVLTGDKILDEEGQPLDGDVFGKPNGAGVISLVLPSGDGTQGGDFSSWFFLGLPPPLEVTGVDPGPVVLVPCKVPAVITATFNVNVTVPPGMPAISVSNQSGKAFPGTLTVGGSQITLTPSPGLPVPHGAHLRVPAAGAFNYTIVVHKGQVFDPNGVPLLTDFMSSFTVLPLTGVTKVSPSDGATMTGPLSSALPVVLTLPNVDLTKVDSTNFKVIDTNTKAVVDGTISFDAAASTVTFTASFSAASVRVSRRGARAKVGTGGTGTGGGTVGGTTGQIVIPYSVNLLGTKPPGSGAFTQIVDKSGCMLDGAGTGVAGSDFLSSFSVVNTVGGQ